MVVFIGPCTWKDVMNMFNKLTAFNHHACIQTILYSWAVSVKSTIWLKLCTNFKLGFALRRVRLFRIRNLPCLPPSRAVSVNTPWHTHAHNACSSAVTLLSIEWHDRQLYYSHVNCMYFMYFGLGDGGHHHSYRHRPGYSTDYRHSQCRH